MHNPNPNPEFEFNVFQIKSTENLDNLKVSSKHTPINLHHSLFVDLGHLRRLILVNCDFSNVSNDSLKILVTLEILEIKNPTNCSHIKLESLKNLRWLEVAFDKSKIQDMSNTNLEILK